MQALVLGNEVLVVEWVRLDGEWLFDQGRQVDVEIALGAPSLALSAAAERAAALPMLYLSRWRTVTLSLAKITLPALAALSMIPLSALPLWIRSWQLEGGTAASLVRAELVLIGFALAALALGLLCSVLFVEDSPVGLGSPGPNL